MGAKEVSQCSKPAEADQFLSQGGYTLIIADEGDVRWMRGSTKIQSFEFIIQTLILGCFPDEI
jgi:hypothetical protein